MDRSLGQPVLPNRGGIPPETHALPAESRVNLDEQIHWWRPSWRDAFHLAGYRWLLWTPIVMLLLLVGIGLAALSYILIGSGGALLIMGFKAAVLAFGAVVAIVGALLGLTVRRAAQARREPFCVFCGYNLTGLPDHHRCPECGRHYTWQMIDEYRRDPQWFIERYKAKRFIPPKDIPFDAGSIPRRRKARDGTE
ncbi:MAG TPA: hypothetical protein VLM89_06760 [Phycisphaerae bacterium]|nr:hypothetical protein [Phycisphaerae bacterium]